MFIKRKIIHHLQSLKKSILLLGPRQTGKSTLIRQLRPSLEINLADEWCYLQHLKDPSLIKRMVSGHKKIFIDEVQRIPSILNTVQFLLDRDPTLQFFLTASSARKLKRGHANLLPGRVLSYELGPLCAGELGALFSLEKAMRRGLLPGVYLEKDEVIAQKILRTYAATYLREEVQAESLTRNLEGFARFFDVVASRSGDFVDFSKYASQAMVDRASVKRYFEILKDTLLIYVIPPFAKSRRVRLVQHPRYYFFDIGVLHGALENFTVSQDRLGRAFEHLFLQNLFSEAKAEDVPLRVSVYRTERGAEVDFVIEMNQELYAVEVKATKSVHPSDLRGLKSFQKFYSKKHRSLLVYLGEESFFLEGVQVCSFQKAFQELGF